MRSGHRLKTRALGGSGGVVRGARCAAGVKTVRRQRGPATPPSACAHLNCHLLPANAAPALSSLSLSLYLLSAPRERQRHRTSTAARLLLIDSRDRERASVARGEKRRKRGPGEREGGGVQVQCRRPIEYGGNVMAGPAPAVRCRLLNMA
jgi:hypothetical protein